MNKMQTNEIIDDMPDVSKIDQTNLNETQQNQLLFAASDDGLKRRNDRLCVIFVKIKF